MERDSLVVHGGSSLLLDRLFHCSDPYDVNVCASCGHMTGSNRCRECDSGTEVRSVGIPYATKLLFQELTAMGIGIRMGLKESNESRA